MISIERLSVEFSARPLFSDVSYIVNDKDRIALVGKNGAGKSTMLKIIAGVEHPTGGNVTVPNGTTIGYLPQVMVLHDSCTVRDETEKAFAHLHEIERSIAEMEREMSVRDDYDSAGYMQLCERFTHESERLEMMGGREYMGRLERTLMGLGFRQADLERPTSEFSGGWRMRIELAKILLMQPDVLLLDEPTNHLDIESIQWLEQFLATYSGAVMLVSHDRAFINNVTNRTLEISCGRIYDYRVRYDEYVALRAERREQQLRAWENQQKEIADTKAFIDRFRYQATKAIQVQQRIRQLEKMVPVEVDEVDNSSLHLRFTCSQRSGDYPVICNEAAKEYDHVVFEHVNLTIRRGEKVAFVGKNGEGKSTMVKCIMGEIPFRGEVKVGHNVQIGYFAQNTAQMLDGELTVYDTIDRVARGDIRTKIRDILGAFMFGGEASERKVKFLSGGERTRLAMIKLLLEPVNLLILDEPTNHLDLKSKDVLKEAIRDFDGTVIIVSHDRDFLDGLVQRVYEFGGGRVREYLGGIYDWIHSHETGQVRTLAPAQEVKVEAAKPVAAVSERKQSYEEQKAQARAQKKREKALAEAEAEVTQLESAISILEQQMATEAGAQDMVLYEKHARLKQQLATAEEHWMELME
ncbi:MAG: ABC-F family ATP-binding cassette domain-containing protein [Bacteroidaceae bacterium]|nr:ABC-F family ATP-binding cassette domain-containing protein [Bacteroidaceae bacterium]